jgi:hypothetical protein
MGVYDKIKELSIVGPYSLLFTPQKFRCDFLSILYWGFMCFISLSLSICFICLAWRTPTILIFLVTKKPLYAMTSGIVLSRFRICKALSEKN